MLYMYIFNIHLGSSVAGQYALQWPQLFPPVTCLPSGPTFVEHQGLSSPISQAQFEYFFPLYSNGKTHGFPTWPPPVVRHSLTSENIKKIN